MKREGVKYEADLSACGLYRWSLYRDWSNGGQGGGSSLSKDFVVIGLNPSVADHERDDPTIRRCMDFAKREGCDQLVMLNMFAYRSTDPHGLQAFMNGGGVARIVGEKNDDALRLHCAAAAGGIAKVVVVAWGAHGKLGNRDLAVARLLCGVNARPLCFGLTKGRHPKHPLYLKADTPLVPWAP